MLKTMRSDLYLGTYIDYDMFKHDGEWLIPEDQILFYEIIEQNKIETKNIKYINEYNYYYRVGQHNQRHQEKLFEEEVIIRKKQTDYYKKLNTNEHDK